MWVFTVFQLFSIFPLYLHFKSYLLYKLGEIRGNRNRHSLVELKKLLSFF